MMSREQQIEALAVLVANLVEQEHPADPRTQVKANALGDIVDDICHEATVKLRLLR